MYKRYIPLLALLLILAASMGSASSLVNPGFELVDAEGKLIGWQVHTGLDPNRYGPPDYECHFGMIVPGQGTGGRSGSDFCAAFPREGTWLGRIFEHHFGRDSEGNEVDGPKYGKAALTQTVTLDPGTYVFGVWLRTADGAGYSGGFSLGWNLGDTAEYANDGSTGIHWTAHDLAVKTSFDNTGGLRERGEWLRHETKPFSLEKRGKVTVWIRLNYVNNHDMPTRWQADDASIEPCSRPHLSERLRMMPSAGSPLTFPAKGQIIADCADDGDQYLAADEGSTVRGDIRTRIFQHARCARNGASFTYELPVDPKLRVAHLAFEHLGPFKLTIGGRVVRSDKQAVEDRIYSREYVLTDRSLWQTGKLQVKFEPAVADKELAVVWIEAGSATRFRERLKHVEWDTVGVPWRIGLWDADWNEFRGQERTFVVGKTDPSTLNGRDIRIEWHQRVKRGHRYWLLLGYFHNEGDEARGQINMGDDYTVELVGKTTGHEVLNFDVTDYIKEGQNVASVQAQAIDFVALVETAPGITDNRKLGIYFAGDETADNITRVLHNSMFWVLDSHYDGTGFIDASIPRGKWWNQYWPIDIAMAMRSMLYWGFTDQAANTARFVAKMSWEGHESNRSGSWDNTGGNILVTDMCEILNRSNFSPEMVRALWPRLSSYCDQLCEEAAKSPFGMIKGTNWENAGNHDQGPCYAISTNLLAAWYLRKAADTSDEGRLGGDVDSWRSTARSIRDEVLNRLVFKEDVASPTGWKFPKGTWAYGLLDDGSYMLRPLAGYLWAGRLGTSYYGFIDPDSELRGIYNATEDAALPLVGGQEDIVSGYASSYDGEQTLLGSAALSDKTHYMAEMISHVVKSLDYKEDKGSPRAEISRWVVGPPGWCEDTNLVGVAEFLDWPRYIVGVDDMLYEGAQLSLVPRLPTCWNECGVNDWLVQYLRDGGRAETRLSYNYKRSEGSAVLRVKTDALVEGLGVRMGPFPAGADVNVSVDGRETHGRRVVNHGNAWIWVNLNTDPSWHTVSAEWL